MGQLSAESVGPDHRVTVDHSLGKVTKAVQSQTVWEISLQEAAIFVME